MADKQRSFEVPAGRCLSVAPGLPTTDMARTVDHYRRIGFTFSAPGSASPAEAGFAIAKRDGIELHFAVKQDHDPARTATWVYVGVEDADVMSEEFAAAGAGQGRPVRTTDYNMRELPHIDPDGNLLLFGSPLPRDPQDPARQDVAGQSGPPTAKTGQRLGTAPPPSMPPPRGTSVQPWHGCATAELIPVVRVRELPRHALTPEITSPIQTGPAGCARLSLRVSSVGVQGVNRSSAVSFRCGCVRSRLR